MAVDSPAFIDSALKVYHVEVHRAIKAQEEQLSQLCSARDQLQQTMQTLAELPDRLRHTAMIPLGKHAFFPGHLTRTNEVMVHLGDQYFVETTAAAARGILQRKLDVVSTGVSRAEQQLQALRARLDVTQSSLREDAADGEATEIRSSLEESDALLASAASKRKQAAAAARQRHQQQGQGVVSRVRTASGYSYTPLGLSEVQQQQQQQQQQDPEDAALQARLEELIRLEEQQQQQAEEQDAPWDHQQQQQQLASIQEGEEEDEGEEPAAAADSKAGVHAAAQHLQQLEEQTDSDDEDAPQHRLLPPQQQQQQQDGRQQHEKAAAAGHIAASTAAAPSRPPLKSALKKGFLTSPSKPKASSSSSSTSSSSSSTASGSGSSSAAQRSSATAFTGAVVERPVLAVDDSETVTAVPAVVERVPLAAPPPASTSSASRPSKFKLRRMGLEASE